MPLITNGFFKYTRNPNFLGEILIYLTFAIITKNNKAFKVLAVDWSILFPAFIFMKEMSLSKKKGWLKYKAMSNLLLPRMFSSKIVDTLAWVSIFIGGYYFRKNRRKILSLLKTK